MKREFRNLLWAEYIFYCEDLLNFIQNTRLVKILESVKEFHEFSHITQRIEISLDWIDEARRMLSRIKGECYLGKSLDVDLHLRFGSLVRRIAISYNDIVVILPNETSSLRLSTDLPERRPRLDRLDKLLSVPPQATKVFNKFMDECLRTIYGRDFPWNFGIPKPMPVSLYSDYRYLSPSKAICTPPNDVTNLCRWSTVAHELMHSKIDDILGNFYTLGYALSTKNPKLVKESQNALDRLVEDPSEVYYRIIELRDLFTELMKFKSGEAYREAYSLLVEDDYYIPRYFLNFQFQEILCDITCTRIAGPAEAIVRGYTNADYCRNPELDVFNHLHDLAHPPHSVRVMYEFDVIRGTSMNLRGEVIDTIEKQLWGLVGIDVLNREPSKAEDLSRYLIKVYIDSVKELLPDFSQLTDDLLAEQPLFGQDRWDNITDVYRKFSEGKALQGDTLRPFDLTNLAWLKVIDVFNQTIGKGGSYDDFIEKRKIQTKFFEDLWKIAHSRPAE